MGEDRDWVEVVAAGACPECGFDAGAVTTGALAEAAAGEGPRWSAWLAGVGPDDDRLAAAPEPGRWSALQEVAHVRDVLDVFADRVARTLAEDNPELGWWDHEAAAEGYVGLVPAEVVAGLAAKADRLGSLLSGVGAEGWPRAATRRTGERFTVAGLARFALHESRHHLFTADRALTRQWPGVATELPVAPGPMPRVGLQGARVRLEPMGRHHVAGLAAASVEGRDTYGLSWIPEGEEEVRAYVERALAGEQAGYEVPFVTVDARTGRIVGSTRFNNLEEWRWPAGHPLQRAGRPDVCEIGATWLAPSAQRTGINREAKLLMLGHAFEVWEVHRVCLRTDRRNLRSQRAMEGLGAIREGVRRADRPGADGTVRDSVFYSVVAGEWPAVKARLLASLDRPTGRLGSI